MATGKYQEWLEEEGLIKITGWAKDGLTDAQISNNMGIAVGTLYEWKKNYPKINDALKKGKEVVDFEVENALFKRAMGYTVKLLKQKVNKYGIVVDAYEEMNIPPDTLACIFWLKNRKPDRWRDKPKDEDDERIVTQVEKLLDKLGSKDAAPVD